MALKNVFVVLSVGCIILRAAARTVQEYKTRQVPMRSKAVGAVIQLVSGLSAVREDLSSIEKYEDV